MAKRTAEDKRFSKLKARVARYGCQLFRDVMGKMYIFDPSMDMLCAVGLDEKTIEAELEALKGEHDEAAPPALRRAVKRVVKAYRDGGQDLTIEFDNALAELQSFVDARIVGRPGGAA